MALGGGVWGESSSILKITPLTAGLGKGLEGSRSGEARGGGSHHCPVRDARTEVVTMEMERSGQN